MQTHDQAAKSEADLEQALQRIDSGTAVAQGLRQLADLADAGVDEARYRLGAMQAFGQVMPRDLDQAMTCLEGVRGGLHRTTAKILIAWLHAQGTPRSPADPALAARLFTQASAELDRELASFEAGEPQTPQDVERRTIWYEDSIALKELSQPGKR